MAVQVGAPFGSLPKPCPQQLLTVVCREGVSYLLTVFAPFGSRCLERNLSHPFSQLGCLGLNIDRHIATTHHWELLSTAHIRAHNLYDATQCSRHFRGKVFFNRPVLAWPAWSEVKNRVKACEFKLQKLGIYIVQMNLTPQTSTFAVCPQTMFSTFPIHVSWEPDQSYHGYCCKLELVRARSMLGLQSLQFICHWLLTVASVSLGLPMQLELSCLQV